MDKAFLRRFYRIINIPFPNYAERKLIWEKTLGESFTYEDGLLDRMAKDYQLVGGSIHNVVSDGVIKALKAKSKVITFEMMELALRSEFNTTGRKYEVCLDEMVHQNKGEITFEQIRSKLPDPTQTGDYVDKIIQRLE